MNLYNPRDMMLREPSNPMVTTWDSPASYPRPTHHIATYLGRYLGNGYTES